MRPASADFKSGSTNCFGERPSGTAFRRDGIGENAVFPLFSGTSLDGDRTALL
jgi:hypothetical protein